MRILMITAIAAMGLAACGDGASSGSGDAPVAVSGSDAAAYQVKIADVDFLNLNATQELAKKLSPEDTYAFLLYSAAWKAAKVSGDESEIRDSAGALPLTVRDAVAIQKAVAAKGGG